MHNIFNVTTLYAGIFGLLVVGFSFYITRARRTFNTAIGSGNSDVLARRIAVQRNLVDYTLYGLLLMLLLEAHLVSVYILHGIGILLLVGRLLHAYGILVAEPRNNRFICRIAGMVITFAVLALASIFAIYLSVTASVLVV